MFSSILPSVSSTLKFGQNGSSKQNRFSARVFNKAQEAAPYAYPMNPPNFVDMGYRPMEQVPPNWYPNNTIPAHYAPPARPAYTIYPNGMTYIYEHSLDSKSDIYSASDMDTLSITTTSAFSPAFSIDSTMALKSPVDDRPMESQIPRSAASSVRTGYPSAPSMQAPAMSRTPSRGHVPEAYLTGSTVPLRGVPAYAPPGVPPMPIPQMMPPAGYHINIPEYDPSTISELEVDERHGIAKINAEYNAASSSSYHSSSATSSPELKGLATAAGIRRAPSASPPKTPTNQQPLHPDLQFPPSRSSRDDFDYNSSLYQDRNGPKFALNASRDGSPPSVERVPSQLPPENEPFSRTPTQHLETRSSPGYDIRNRESTLNSDQITGAPILRRSPSTAPVDGKLAPNPSPPSRYSIYATSPHEPAAPYEQRQTTYSSNPSNSSRQRRSSIVGAPEGFASASRSESQPSITTPYEVPRARPDYRDYETRSGRTTEVPPPSTPKDYVPSGHPNSSDSRRDYFSSSAAPPIGPAIHHSIPATGEPRRDRDRSYEDQYRSSTRSSPPSRRQSYANDPPMKMSKDRSSPDTVLQTGILTSSPKDIQNDPTAYEPVPTPIYADRPHDYNRTRERANSLSKSSRPDVPPATPTSAHTRNPPYPDSRYPSDYERESDRDRENERDRDRPRRDRSGTIVSERSPPSRSRTSDEGHYQRPHEQQSLHNDREGQRGLNSVSQLSLQGYPEKEQRERLPPRRSATVETASSSSGSPDSSRSRKPSLFDDQSTKHETRIPQPPAYSPPRHELHRRQSDGDKQPYDVNSVMPPSFAPHHEKRPSSSASSSSKTSSSGASSSSRSTGPLPVPPPPEPHRRYSDGDQNPMPIRPPTLGRTSIPLSRSVRWNENLVAPSPMLAPQRRKGWYNRRGDQLWTNDGSYRTPAPGQEFPPDLDEYPDFGEGWMNEECVRIDMSHRLIPKVPLRSALKNCVTKA